MNYSRYLATLDINLSGSIGLELLSTLVERHNSRFTFNNLGVLLHENLSLDSQCIFDKVVQRNSGGYCFEHNKIIYEVLQHLGFEVKLALARVINNHERPVPRTHRITLVQIAGKRYLVDAGFGAACPIQPLELDTEAPQSAGVERYLIRLNDLGEHELFVFKAERPFLLYRFDLADYTDADCEMGHFYSHKHPAAVFVKNLVVSKKNRDETFSLINHEFRHKTAFSESYSFIDTPEQLKELLNQIFGLRVELEVCDFLHAHYIAPKLIESQNH